MGQWITIGFAMLMYGTSSQVTIRRVAGNLWHVIEQNVLSMLSSAKRKRGSRGKVQAVKLAAFDDI